MCVNQYKVYNKWTKTHMFVPCGVCPACLMEKANHRLRRIKNSISPGTVSLFVTLTYAPKFLPYIKPSDLSDHMSVLNVYRDYDVIKVRKNKDYDVSYQFYKRSEPLKTIDCFLEKLYYYGEKLPRARGSRSKIGILYYKDLQDFCKRLERNLFRHYGLSGSCYKMFKVSEYGETYFRPHFHLLIHLPSEYLDKFYAAIRASWPFDNQGLDRQIEIAKNASSYVSRYVCRGSDFPRFFENSCFKPKSSFSKGFGLANTSFSLPNIISSVDRGSCSYSSTVHIDGKDSVVDLLYPKYLLNRYFFKFKGYSRLSFDELFQLLQAPVRIYQYGPALGYVITPERDDFRNTLSVLRSRFRRFCAESGFSGRLVDMQRLFAYYYYCVWRCYSSNVYRLMFKDVLSHDPLTLYECYDNISHVRDGIVMSDLKVPDSVSDDPNLFHRNFVRTQRLELDYFNHIKKKKVSNMAYRTQGMKI